MEKLHNIARAFAQLKVEFKAYSGLRSEGLPSKVPFNNRSVINILLSYPIDYDEGEYLN
jgi:hypothetical protein